MNDDKELIDKGTYYEIKDYEPIVNRDENGNVVSVIHCPYIPKFLYDGGDTGSTGCSKDTKRPKAHVSCKR